MVIDIGGATTDVRSACWGKPSIDSTPIVGLPEPFAKRTVEGDLGLRVSAIALLEASHRTTLPQKPGQFPDNKRGLATS